MKEISLSFKQSAPAPSAIRPFFSRSKSPALPHPLPTFLPYILLCYLPLSPLSSLSPDLFTPPTQPLLLSTRLGGATKFSLTTLPFCCLLIESLSPSNGSVRIIPEHRRAGRLIEGEIQRDKGTARDAKREAKSKRRDLPGPGTVSPAPLEVSEQRFR